MLRRLSIILTCLVPSYPLLAQSSIIVVASPSQITYGGSLALTIHTALTSNPSDPTSIIGQCTVQEAASGIGDPSYDEPFNFSTDAGGNYIYNTPSDYTVGKYRVNCTSPSSSTSGSVNFTIIGNSCFATDGSSVVSQTSSVPSTTTITWSLDIILTPAASSPPNPTPASGTGITGMQTGYKDCNANPITIAADPPMLISQGYIPYGINGIKYNWVVISSEYDPMSPCTSGYCNGFKSLGFLESTSQPYSVIGYCN